MIKITNLDDVIKSSPLNITAALVTKQSNEDIINKKYPALHSENPIKTKKISKKYEDITGFKFGRFTVMGLFKHKNNVFSTWVCRCICGNYEIRSKKSIKNPENFGDRCHECRNLAYVKKRDIWRRTGKEMDMRNL